MSNPANLEVAVWVLSGAFAFYAAITIPAIGYFLVREFNKKDDLGSKVEAFGSAIVEVRDMVHETRLLVEELRNWSSEHFVTRPEFDKAVKSLEDEDTHIMKSVSDRINEKLQHCQDLCPFKGEK